MDTLEFGSARSKGQGMDLDLFYQLSRCIDSISLYLLFVNIASHLILQAHTSAPEI